MTAEKEKLFQVLKENEDEAVERQEREVIDPDDQIAKLRMELKDMIHQKFPDVTLSELKLDEDVEKKLSEEATDLSTKSCSYLMEILVNKEKDVEDFLAIYCAPNPSSPSSSQALLSAKPPCKVLTRFLFV
ncbi:hypothetical protein Tco_1376167 [Tanacetum coccineum]